MKHISSGNNTSTTSDRISTVDVADYIERVTSSIKLSAIIPVAQVPADMIPIASTPPDAVMIPVVNMLS